MSEKRVPEQESMRLFVALDAPTAVLERVQRWQLNTVSGERLRPVAFEALHVTLEFLGQRPSPVAEEVGQVLAELEPGPVEGRLLPKPVPIPRRRPRLLALEVESPAAVALQAELRRCLRGVGIDQPDERPERPYWPHLTVFRLRRRGRAPARVPPLDGGDGQTFGFRRIALYRSDLRPEGASYSLLAANDLPQTGGQRGD